MSLLYRKSARKSRNRPGSALLVAVAVTVVMLVGAGGAQAATPPVKLVPSGHITGGFHFPKTAAVNDDPGSPTYGNVYVADGDTGCRSSPRPVCLSRRSAGK